MLLHHQIKMRKFFFFDVPGLHSDISPDGIDEFSCLQQVLYEAQDSFCKRDSLESMLCPCFLGCVCGGGGGGGGGGAELQSMFWGVLARANCSKQMGRCKKMSVHPRCDKGTSRTNVMNMYIRCGSW